MQIACHLRNYTEPVFQRYIIRIIFMVPVYAIGSFFSLRWPHGAIYFDTIRDCYEAWIIYNFSSLLLAYVGGPGAVVVKAEGKQVHPSWAHLTCCLPTMQVDGFFLRRCKQGTLQFVLMKPVIAALTLILYAAGAYTDGDMSPKDGYFYISILYNVCYTFALYGLLLFWIGASELLQPYNPLLKFVLVKTVVFLTFWQGIGISAINSLGELSDPEDGKALQNFMICAEMAVAGIALLYAFPHKEYQIGGSAAGFRASAFVHAISIKDVVSDTIHVFAPSYSDYVLYSDGGPADNAKRKTYRGQHAGAGEHPKAKLMKNMDKGVLGEEDPADGRNSKTPAGEKAMKRLEANRNQAILLDSDSDGIDSDEEGINKLGTQVAADSASSDEECKGRNRAQQHHAARALPNQLCRVKRWAEKRLVAQIRTVN
eukprot:gene11616-11760_t